MYFAGVTEKKYEKEIWNFVWKIEQDLVILINFCDAVKIVIPLPN